jgi:hypothetical protein
MCLYYTKYDATEALPTQQAVRILSHDPAVNHNQPQLFQAGILHLFLQRPISLLVFYGGKLPQYHPSLPRTTATREHLPFSAERNRADDSRTLNSRPASKNKGTGTIVRARRTMDTRGASRPFQSLSEPSCLGCLTPEAWATCYFDGIQLACFLVLCSRRMITNIKISLRGYVGNSIRP